MSDEKTPAVPNENPDRSRLMLLGSLTAAAASGGCGGTTEGSRTQGAYWAGQQKAQRDMEAERQREIERRQNLSTEEQLRMRQERISRTRPAAPPMMERGGEGGGGGGGGGSH